MKYKNIKEYTIYNNAISEAKKNPGVASFTEENTIKTYPLPHVYLSDLFDDKKLENLIDYPQVIPFLDAQTGSGKTTLIIEKLFPILKKRGQRLCYLVPRTSLCDHIKKDFANQNYHCKNQKNKHRRNLL